MKKKLVRLLTEFQFSTMATVYSHEKRSKPVGAGKLSQTAGAAAV